MNTEPCLVVFCKRPKLGQGKQRLREHLTAKQTFEVASALLACTLEDISTWQGDVVFTVSDKQDIGWAKVLLNSMPSVANEPYQLQIIAQPEGNLGQRINQLDQQLRHQGYKHLVFIGTDAPMLNAQYFQQMTASLIKNNVSLSLSDDGGVIMMGSSIAWPDLEPLPWSTQYLADALVDSCSHSGLSVGYIDAGFDTDTLNDLYKMLPLLQHDERNSRQDLNRLILSL